jgi:hypothetical protein
MRVWDALLSEGTKILYRVALALLKTHEDALMAQDNAGYMQREMKLASARMHDRDALMKVIIWCSNQRLHRPLPALVPQALQQGSQHTGLAARHAQRERKLASACVHE